MTFMFHPLVVLLGLMYRLSCKVHLTFTYCSNCAVCLSTNIKFLDVSGSSAAHYRQINSLTPSGGPQTHRRRVGWWGVTMSLTAT